MKELKLYPIFYDGKKWKEEDCDDVFVSFYHCRYNLNVAMGVYIGDDIWVYPDGKKEEW